MEEAGYRPPKVRRDDHPRRYEAVRPNHLWHLDLVHRHIHRSNTLILIDDHSRFVVAHGVDDAERADMVVGTFTEAVTRHGRPEAVMHDKGPAFRAWNGISRFTALLTELGVDHVVAGHKEWNGKVEVFNGNLAKELFDVRRFYDVGEMKRRLAAYLHGYNHRRTHHVLGGLLVPADRYYGRVDEVLARIEACAGASVHTDLLDLRARPGAVQGCQPRRTPRGLAAGTAPAGDPREGGAARERRGEREARRERGAARERRGEREA
ncbi:MAG: transposase, partial [Deltaproteobacteria bacterium]|nr:transposase [Deltaproteobacteria bacterium]